jgi:hypothetical protein
MFDGVLEGGRLRPACHRRRRAATRRLVAVGFNPRWRVAQEESVASRRREHTPASQRGTVFSASLRDALFIVGHRPWTEVHGYHSLCHYAARKYSATGTAFSPPSTALPRPHARVNYAAHGAHLSVVFLSHLVLYETVYGAAPVITLPLGCRSRVTATVLEPLPSTLVTSYLWSLLSPNFNLRVM